MLNLPIAVILKKKLSLYDLQKPRYEYGHFAATPKKKGVALQTWE